MEKEKITVQTVIDDVVGGVLTGVGVVGGSVAMKYASGKVNPWLVPVAGIVLGIAGRIGSNYVSNKKVKEGIKDFSNGIAAAGALDLTVKTVKQFAPNLLATLPAEVQAAIPSLSGGERMESYSQAVVPSLYGYGDMLNGDYQEARVMSSSLLS